MASPDETDGPEARLPVDFPAGQFLTAMWVAVGVSVAVGLITFGRLQNPPADVTAMAVVLVSTYLVVRPYTSLQLPVRVAAVVVLGQALLAWLMVLAVPHYDQPDVVHWSTFPAELVLVVLVIRRRVGWAFGALAAHEVGVAWTCFASGLAWDGLLRAGSGPVLFVAMAVLVTGVLRAISRRQVLLRTSEDDALDASVRQHVAVVQRALWMADLRSQSRSVLERLALTTGPVPDGLRDEALLLEATLRESLVARNVMSDELAVLTESARRRGINVRLVDSRRTTVLPTLGQALLDVVRRALAVPDVTRLVVRLAPEGSETAASVLTVDTAGTHLVRIDASGVVIRSEVGNREP